MVRTVYGKAVATARSIHVRLDEAADSALTAIAGDDLTPSEAVRLALSETAARRRRRHSLAAEARRLADDPDYRAEVAEVQELMDELRAPW